MKRLRHTPLYVPANTMVQAAGHGEEFFHGLRRVVVCLLVLVVLLAGTGVAYADGDGDEVEWIDIQDVLDQQVADQDPGIDPGDQQAEDQDPGIDPGDQEDPLDPDYGGTADQDPAVDPGYVPDADHGVQLYSSSTPWYWSSSDIQSVTSVMNLLYGGRDYAGSILHLSYRLDQIKTNTDKLSDYSSSLSTLVTNSNKIVNVLDYTINNTNWLSMRNYFGEAYTKDGITYSSFFHYTLLTQFSHVKTRLDTANTNLTSIASKLDTVNTKLTSIASKLDTVNTNLTSIASKLDTANTRLNSLITLLTGTNSRLDKLVLWDDPDYAPNHFYPLDSLWTSSNNRFSSAGVQTIDGTYYRMSRQTDNGWYNSYSGSNIRRIYFTVPYTDYSISYPVLMPKVYYRVTWSWAGTFSGTTQSISGLVSDTLKSYSVEDRVFVTYIVRFSTVTMYVSPSLYFTGSVLPGAASWSIIPLSDSEVQDLQASSAVNSGQAEATQQLQQAVDQTEQFEQKMFQDVSKYTKQLNFGLGDWSEAAAGISYIGSVFMLIWSNSPVQPIILSLMLGLCMLLLGRGARLASAAPESEERSSVYQGKGRGS